jgi:hypothetical protein
MNKIKENNEQNKQAEIVVKGEKRYLKTPRGTELPLLQLRGKDYLQVAHRLVWFREEHPEWQILTKPLEINFDKKYAIFRSSIVNDNGKTLATATKGESIAGFNDYIEKAETSATGRALALCGFGTQFAPELDEGDRLADSPVEVPKKQLPVVNSVAFIRESGKIPATVIKREADNAESEACQHCGSNHLTIGLTKADNPRNPNRPYWKCLNCPPEKSFSHWVKDGESNPEVAQKVANREKRSGNDQLSFE